MWVNKLFSDIICVLCSVKTMATVVNWLMFVFALFLCLHCVIIRYWIDWDQNALECRCSSILTTRTPFRSFSCCEAQSLLISLWKISLSARFCVHMLFLYVTACLWFPEQLMWTKWAFYLVTHNSQKYFTNKKTQATGRVALQSSLQNLSLAWFTIVLPWPLFHNNNNNKWWWWTWFTGCL